MLVKKIPRDTFKVILIFYTLLEDGFYLSRKYKYIILNIHLIIIMIFNLKKYDTYFTNTKLRRNKINLEY
jgi:hypothetical protein